MAGSDQEQGGDAEGANLEGGLADGVACSLFVLATPIEGATVVAVVVRKLAPMTASV